MNDQEEQQQPRQVASDSSSLLDHPQNLREPLLASPPSDDGGSSTCRRRHGEQHATQEEGGEAMMSASENGHPGNDNSHDAADNNNNNNKNIVLRLPACCCLQQPQEQRILIDMNHNVCLELLLCVTYGMSDSLWAGTVLAAYLKKLGQLPSSSAGGSSTGANGWVGNVEAANGLASLVTALPVGYLADTLVGGRSKVLKFGGLLILGTALLNGGLFVWIGTPDDGDHDMMSEDQALAPHTELYLAGIMALWGTAGGIVDGPAQALFADSIPQGKRSRYYMYLFVCYNIASCLGPLTSIGLFQWLGDDWDLYDLRLVMYVGLVLEMINGVLMMFFDDSKALDEDTNNNEGEEDEEPTAESENIAAITPLIASNTRTSTPATGANDTDSPEDEGQPSTDQTACINTNHLSPFQAERAWMVPYIIFIHSLVFALGSGMTVKFFPLFFKDEVGMSPSQVQIIYLILPLVLAGCSGLGQTISQRGGIGRVETALLFKIVGVSGLYSMVVFKDYLDNHAFLLVPIYILRTAFMNASYPLEESILMDFVPKNQRGRWKSLESIAAFGWCGSAALGGWTSDHAHGDYTYTFRITAMIQSLGIITWALLLPLVPRHEAGEDNGSDSSPADVESNENSNSNQDVTSGSVVSDQLSQLENVAASTTPQTEVDSG